MTLAPAHGTRALPARLELLGGFTLHLNGRQIPLPINAQRVLAYLAITDRDKPVCSRAALAERLWSEALSGRPQASLRTALWRIRQADRSLVETGSDTLRLDADVDVDLHRSIDQAGCLLGEDSDALELVPSDFSALNLSADLLPGWEEEWLLVERERIRQLRVHAIEALADLLRRCGRYGEAVDAALRVIGAEPLRESAHVALVRIFLDEGNVVEAHRHYDRYAAALWNELRLAPSRRFAACVGRIPAGLR
jgi:DNA-binding SARP family transcriptional activator